MGNTSKQNVVKEPKQEERQENQLIEVIERQGRQLRTSLRHQKEFQIPDDEEYSNYDDEEPQQKQEEDVVVHEPVQEKHAHFQEQPLEIKHQNNIQSNAVSQQPHTLRSEASQQYQHDPEQSSKLLNELIIESIPKSEVKIVKSCERKRILLLWLKQGADSVKQKQRDSLLRQNGYQLFSSRQILEIKEKYEECSAKWLTLTTIVIFSYSNYYNNEQTIKQLHEYFIQSGKTSKLLIIKPPDQNEYRIQLNNIKANKAIVELSYQIEFVRHKIAESEGSQFQNSVNFIPLKYWQDYEALVEVYNEKTLYEAFVAKSKVSLFACLKIGQTLIDVLEAKNYFKIMLKSYAFFHDLYLNDSLLMKTINKNENYLKRIGMKLLEDPINFYLNATHELAINRVLKYCVDMPQLLNNIILPLNLLFHKIREEYRKDCISKKYLNQFICYYEMIMNDEELSFIVKDTIFENLGFIKASLKQYDLKNNHFEVPTNVLLIIRVRPVERDLESDMGYYFIGSAPKDIDDQQEQSKKQGYFQGFTYVLINLFNSFHVVNRHYDHSLKKHIIELEYGEVAAQIQRRRNVNFISDEQVAPRYIQKQHEIPVDYETIIKYESCKGILEKISDFGDCLSLLARHNDAIAYYDAIFAKCKTQISEDVIILSNFQNKKGLNFELGKSSEVALQYFYNAYNFIRKTKKISQIELNVMHCLQRMHEYQKMISFGQTLVNLSKKYKIMDELSPYLLLQLYGLIARGYEKKNTTDFQIRTNPKQIMNNYDQGLLLIEKIGEYCQFVPDFYYNIGRYYLSIRSAFDALIYLNKSLLLKKTILTENHPQLCPLYEILAIAYVCMHDYSQALNAINSAYQIYEKYYQKGNFRFLVVYEIRGKINVLMNKLPQALQSFQNQREILERYMQKKKYKNSLERKYVLKNIHIGLYNLIQEKQLVPYISKVFRKDKSEACLVYVLIYLSHIYKLEYNYPQALAMLQSALKLNSQEMGPSHFLNLEVLYQISDILIQGLNWNKAESILKQAFSLLGKMRKQQDYEASKYYEQLFKMNEYRRNYQQCLKNLGKMKELAFRLQGRQSLLHCRICSKIGKVHVSAQNLNEAKLYFQECEGTLQTLLLKARSNPSSTKLQGNDLESYIKNIEIEMSESLENKGLLEERNGNHDNAIERYKESIESYKQTIGQYHPRVAMVYFLIGLCLFKKGVEFYDKSIQEVKRSISIYITADSHKLNSRLPLHLLLAKIYEGKNELTISIEELCNGLDLLRKMHRIGIDYLQILKEINRIVEVIITQPTIRNLKNAYFIIAKAFSEERDQITVDYDRGSEFGHEIGDEISHLLANEELIRLEIEKSDTKEERQEKQLIQRLQEKEHYISLDKIKENLQIRKKLRQKKN